ncbi:hypothetical protein ACGFJ4_30685 [Micromonospora chalcea]|uniref:hypothetical protein n=1 Tax=Micromonospora chalcea TaxID=1874 RepID=UPI00237923F0|nr:hypothetical protein [Micromonospora chalcea]WDP97227.1 hypothetical protein PVK74_14895 [Micromonospora chalcea]
MDQVIEGWRSSDLMYAVLDNHEAKTSRGPVVPWSWLTLSLAVALITCLGTLAVVVSVNNVDTLSTIALALAVLAFAAQLVVSLAQAQGSAQQLTQVERTNSETQSALAEVRSTAQALLSNQSEQFNKVLSAALRSATASVVEEVTDAAADSPDSADGASLDPELIAERVEGRLRKFMMAPSARPESDFLPGWARKPVSEADATTALEVLSKMPAIHIVEFLNRVFHSSKSPRRLDSGTLVRMPDLAVQALVDSGIYVFTSFNEDKSRGAIRLSDKGRLLIRLMMAGVVHREWTYAEMHKVNRS